MSWLDSSTATLYMGIVPEFDELWSFGDTSHSYTSVRLPYIVSLTLDQLKELVLRNASALQKAGYLVSLQSSKITIQVVIQRAQGARSAVSCRSPEGWMSTRRQGSSLGSTNT